MHSLTPVLPTVFAQLFTRTAVLIAKEGKQRGPLQSQDEETDVRTAAVEEVYPTYDTSSVTPQDDYSYRHGLSDSRRRREAKGRRCQARYQEKLENDKFKRVSKP